jgi:transcriptional regulator with XRE-family HTH domain
MTMRRKLKEPYRAVIKLEGKKRILEIAHKNGFSLRTLADKIGYSPAAVSSWTTGQRTLGKSACLEIYKALGEDDSLGFLKVYAEQGGTEGIEAYIESRDIYQERRTKQHRDINDRVLFLESRVDALTEEIPVLSPFYDRIETTYGQLDTNRRCELMLELEGIIQKFGGK